MQGRVLRGNNATCLALSWLSVTSPATHKQIGPFWCRFWVGGFVYILGPHESLQWTLLWGWEFLLLPQPPQVFIARGFEALFPCARTLGCMVSLAPQLFFLLIHMQMWYHLNCQPPCCQFWSTSLPTWSSSRCLARNPLHPCFPSPPFLPAWMYVSSLTLWLLNFHAVWFSGSSGYFLFFNLLSFWLCKEAKCIYLHLHLGRKCYSPLFFNAL